MTQPAKSDPELSIVCPVRDEADNVRGFLDALMEKVRTPLELVVVYDDAEDNTLPVLESRAAGLPFEVRTVQNQFGVGALGAIRTGLRVARCPFVLVTMCDLADDPSPVDDMVRTMKDQRYDVVCGSRYMPGGRQIGGPLLKRTLSRLAGRSLHLMGVPTRDATNSFKLYRKQAVDRLSIESVAGFEIGLEIVVKTHFSGGRVTEVPSTWRDRSAGRSRFRLWRWLPHYARWWLFALRRARRFEPTPPQPTELR